MTDNETPIAVVTTLPETKTPMTLRKKIAIGTVAALAAIAAAYAINAKMNDKDEVSTDDDYAVDPFATIA